MQYEGITLPESVLTRSQKISRKEGYRNEEGKPEFITVTLRYDDECGNGHNTFSITGDINRYAHGGDSGFIAGGCIHEEIIKHFPEYAHLIKWHLCSSDGPMHYVANTVYLAGNRDYYGKEKGQVTHYKKVIRFKGFPIEFSKSDKFTLFLETLEGDYDFEIIPMHHTMDNKVYTKYTFGGFAEQWCECPFNTEQEALQFLKAMQTCGYEVVSTPDRFSEGKERELDAARHAAIWPEATDEELCLPTDELKALLIKRLPALMDEFKRDMEALGFTY